MRLTINAQVQCCQRAAAEAGDDSWNAPPEPRARWIATHFEFIIVLPVNLFLGFIHTWLIPLPMAAEAVAVLARHGGDADAMFGELDEVRTRHETWAVRDGGTADKARRIEHLLWATWPVLAVVAVFLFIFGLRQLKQFYARLANDLESHAISGQFGSMFAKRLGAHGTRRFGQHRHTH